MMSTKLEAGPEIDGLVAERVMGWHLYEWTDSGESYANWMNAAGEFQRQARTGEYRNHWSPSTNWWAMGQVFDRLRADGWVIGITAAGRQSMCSMSRMDLTSFTVWAPTPQLAFCRAALKARETKP